MPLFVSALNSLLATLVWEPAIAPFFIFLIGGILGLLAVVTYVRGSNTRLPLGKRILLLSFRLIAIALVCLFLFQPMIEEPIARRHPKRVALVAVDSPISKDEKDGIDQASRIDTARKLRADSGLIGAKQASKLGDVRLFGFDEDARSLPENGLLTLAADGGTTSFHSSISSILNAVKTDEQCVGMFVFSDGHDFENVPVNQTSQLARARQTPIFPIPIGKQQTIPDITVNIASYSPYTFVKQIATIQRENDWQQ